jgi:hypothetical protein
MRNPKMGMNVINCRVCGKAMFVPINRALIAKLRASGGGNARGECVNGHVEDVAFESPTPTQAVNG